MKVAWAVFLRIWGCIHFQLIASTCLQLRLQWNALIPGRDYTEHICPDPFSPFHAQKMIQLLLIPTAVESNSASWTMRIFNQRYRAPWTTFWMEWWNAEFLCLHPMQTSGLGARSVARCTMRGSTQCQVSFHDGSTHPTCVGTSCIDIQEDVQSWLQARCSGQKIIQSYSSKQIPQSSWMKRNDWHCG